MCSNCGFPAVQGHWTDAGSAEAGDRVRARLKRARILNNVLKPIGMAAHDSIAVPGIQVSTLTGAHEMVDDLAGVWKAVERMRGAPLDPLDPEYVGD
jgi:hypothetical protein